MVIDHVTLILVTIFIIAGYLVIFQTTANSIYNKRMLPILAVVELFVYACVIALIVILYFYFAYDPVVIYSSLIFFAVCALITICVFFIKNRRTNNYMVFGILAVYLVVLFYLTVFMRIEDDIVSTTIKMDAFVNLRLAIEQKSLAPLEHEWMNLLLFLPFGILVPLMNWRKSPGIGATFLMGLIISTGIETTQYAAHLGECDINDIISNTLGALVGCILCKIVLMIRKNWKF